MIEVEKGSRSMEGRIIRIRFSSWTIDNSKNANHQDENIKSIRGIVKFLDSHLEIFQEFRISKRLIIMSVSSSAIAKFDQIKNFPLFKLRSNNFPKRRNQQRGGGGGEHRVTRSIEAKKPVPTESINRSLTFSSKLS